MDSDRKHWVSVAAAIVQGERVLAIRRRDNDKWEPPGGTLEPNESIVDGLRREVREEVGLEVVPDRLTGIYKNMERTIVALVFRCTHDAGSPTNSTEAAEIKWMTKEEVEAHMDPAYACRLLDALTDGAPRVRHHDGINLIEP